MCSQLEELDLSSDSFSSNDLEIIIENNDFFEDLRTDSGELRANVVIVDDMSKLDSVLGEKREQENLLVILHNSYILMFNL